MLNLNLSTILLQMANFFILAFILYRFLFQPLQRTLKKRAEKTTQALDDANLARQEAEKTRSQFEEKVDNIDAEIAARKNEARIIIEQTRQQMLNEVQTQIDQLKIQTEELLTRLRNESIQKHKENVAKITSDFAINIMSDLMSPELQEAYQEKFLDQISETNLKEDLQASSQEDTLTVKIILASSPSKAFQTRLLAELNKDFSRQINPLFEIEPSLIAGGVIRYEDELFDGSLQGQINHMLKKYQEIG